MHSERFHNPLWLLPAGVLLLACGDNQPVSDPVMVEVAVEVSGLEGSGLVLSSNRGGSITPTGDGRFAMPVPVELGESYEISIRTQPSSPPQRCVLTGGVGTAAADRPIAIAVQCTTLEYAISGTVTGLAGTGLVLQNNAGDHLAIGSDGGFTFSAPVVSGQPFEVTVLSQPVAATQICTVANGRGTVSSNAITDVAITCVTRRFPVGGTVSGLRGRGLMLRDANGQDVEISAEGAFVFPTDVASGAPFGVTIASQPTLPSQTCTLGGSSGTVGGDAVTTVTVDCATDRFVLGGTVSGLAGTLVLRAGATNLAEITTNGTFAFPTTVASGESYTITVESQPGVPSQTCTLEGATGDVVASDIASIAVTCRTNHFAVGGTLTGLAPGASVVLRNNGGDNETLTTNGPFAFDTAIASGAAFEVTVFEHPTAPISQTCTATSATGVVGGEPVTSVAVTCATNSFSVRGTLAGLTLPTLLPAGLAISLNGGPSMPLTTNGPFAFDTTLESGSAYAVTVTAQPHRQVCSVANGTGTVGNTDATVAVTCIDSVESCAALLAADPTAASGTYSIDPDGSGPMAAFNAYCDMTTNGGGWTNLDFAANRVLLANGHAVRCFGGLSANASSVTCLQPFFDDARAMPLYHYRCDGGDNSAKYILDWMAPLIGHQGSTTLGFTGYSQSHSGGGGGSEHCYVNGEVVPWNDARCAAYNAPGNGGCVPGRFTLNLAP